jgi:Rps23 Pro-64 3,4-dihydroxylase Tpa1-like proline 4-hydroxylase
MIQKYDKNKGKYVYHDDGAIDILSKNYRVITYLWYLNDVEQGGETEFFGGDLKIKPETGKLLFFPSF